MNYHKVDIEGFEEEHDGLPFQIFHLLFRLLFSMEKMHHQAQDMTFLEPLVRA